MIEIVAEAVGRSVSRETFGLLRRYVQLVEEEAHRQNLVSATTLSDIWQRHIMDSAQLARFSSESGSSWVDIGSGAGLPGIVLAILQAGPVTLAEPRRLRADFLLRVVEELNLAATVVCAKAERVGGRFDVITARAVAPLDRLLGMAHHLSHPASLWVLPKGRNAKSELAEARGNWHYEVRAEPSITDPDSEILLLSNVRAKSKR